MNSDELIWKSASWTELSREDLYCILQARLAVFVVEQDCPYQDCDGKDAASHHLWAQDAEGEVHAYLRIVEPGISYSEPSIGRVLSSLKMRRSGLGRELMRRALEWTEMRYPGMAVRISAQQYLQQFYQDFDFHVVGEVYLEDGIPHLEMLRRP